MKNIIRITFFAAIIAAATFSFGFTSVGNQSTNEIKITVCHTPPGNPGNCHEIEVSWNSLQAHLDHGDALVCHHPEEEYNYSVLAEAAQVALIISY